MSRRPGISARRCTSRQVCACGRAAGRQGGWGGQGRLFARLLTPPLHVTHRTPEKCYDIIVGELLDRCCNTTLQDKEGRTPLLIASECGDLKVCLNARGPRLQPSGASKPQKCTRGAPNRESAALLFPVQTCDGMRRGMRFVPRLPVGGAAAAGPPQPRPLACVSAHTARQTRVHDPPGCE